jgi:hypothetical protein
VETEPLMSMEDARREASELRKNGIPAVAGTVPPGSWGGAEKGWTVYIGSPLTVS